MDRRAPGHKSGVPQIPLRSDDDLRVPASTLLPAAAVTWLLVLTLGLLLLM